MTLAATTEALYATFAAYDAREHIEGCPCCVGHEESARLVRLPLRASSSDELGRYAFKAMTTWGDATGYKHFLPRILELAATPEGASPPGLGLEIITGKLELAGWSSWPPVERNAVLDHLRAFAVQIVEARPESAWQYVEVVSALQRLAVALRPATTIEALSPPLQFIALRLMAERPELRALVHVSDDDAPKLVIRSPTDDRGRDAVFWDDDGDLGLGFGRWHTHGNIAWWVREAGSEEASLIAVALSITDGELVIADHRDGPNEGIGIVLDLHEPDAVLDELTRRGAPNGLRLRTWSGQGDREVCRDEETRWALR
jgi:hypothetical protein